MRDTYRGGAGLGLDGIRWEGVAPTLYWALDGLFWKQGVVFVYLVRLLKGCTYGDVKEEGSERIYTYF